MARLVLEPADHIIGSAATATVQLVTYGDYQCPFTARGIALVDELLARYGGALVYAFRHFPLSHLHPDALRAACAAEAADFQGRFWDMHKKLFRHQYALDGAAVRGYAAELGLDVQRFVRELGETATEWRVLEDRASGAALGVRSTPTFFVDGARYAGPVDGIVALVDEAVRCARVPCAY